MALLGDAYVASGRVTEGLTLLDHVMAAVTAGEVVGVGPAGEIYCRLLSACERATDVSRAEQWLKAATRFEAWGKFVPPTCRTHSGGILIALGRCGEVERELLAAVRAFEAGYWASQLFPLLRLADLRVRQGRFEEAERLLAGIDWHPSAKRSLARIAMARGDVALAEDLVRLCLENTSLSDPDCPPLLALLVEVQLARGDVALAAETLDRLAVWQPTPRMTGHAPSPDSPRPRSGPLKAMSGRGRTSRTLWSCSRCTLFPWKLRRREPRSRARSARTRRQPQSRRRDSRSRRSSVSARPAMPTRVPPCYEHSALRLGRSGRETGPLPGARATSYRCWPKGARTPRLRTGSTSAGAPPSTTSRGSCPSSACETEPRRRPTRCASRRGHP